MRARSMAMLYTSSCGLLRRGAYTSEQTRFLFLCKLHRILIVEGAKKTCQLRSVRFGLLGVNQ